MSVPSGTSIEFVVGDLIEEELDAYIVPFGDPTGTASRVQRHIRRMAHGSLGDEIAQQMARLPGGQLCAGESIATTAAGLKCRHLIHCHFSGTDVSAGGLEQALRGAFALCQALSVRSVAMPAMGTGAYGLPLADVARTSVQLTLNSQAAYPGLSRVRFVLSSTRTLEQFLLARSEFDL